MIFIKTLNKNLWEEVRNIISMFIIQIDEQSIE